MRWMNGTVRTILEVDAIESKAARSCNPVLNIRKGEVELACDLAQGDSAAREQNHLPPVSRRKFFIRCRLAEESCDVSSVPAPLRSASTTLTSQDSSFVITNHFP